MLELRATCVPYLGRKTWKLKNPPQEGLAVHIEDSQMKIGTYAGIVCGMLSSSNSVHSHIISNQKAHGSDAP